MVKTRLPMQETQETWVQVLGREYPLEKGMAAHSSILAGEIPWTEEPGGLWSMESQRVTHDWGAEHKYLLKVCCGSSTARKGGEMEKETNTAYQCDSQGRQGFFTWYHSWEVCSLGPISVSILNGLRYCKGLLLYAISKKKLWKKRKKGENMIYQRN